MTWRKGEYFNPDRDNGQSANLMTTRRVMQDHDLAVTTFGFRLRPIHPLSVNLDATVGRDNAAETPVSPAHHHNIRARVDYRRNKRVRFGGSYRQAYNLNEAPLGYVNPQAQCCAPPRAYYASHSRDLSAAVPNVISSAPGYTSQYVSNIHTVSVTARTTIQKWGALYAGYNINRDTGDGRSQQNRGLANPAASFLAGLNTFPMTYQAPMARLSIEISPKLQWNGGWEFYRYSQKFAYFGYQPYYRAQTGYQALAGRSDCVAPP